MDLAIVQTMFAEIEAVCALNPGIRVILGADMNVDFNTNSHAADYFINKMNDLSLISCHNLYKCDVDYTYCHDGLQNFSYVDYFLVSSVTFNEVVHYNVIELADNLSDHNQIITSINMEIDRNAESKPVQKVNKTLRW